MLKSRLYPSKTKTLLITLALAVDLLLLYQTDAAVLRARRARTLSARAPEDDPSTRQARNASAPLITLLPRGPRLDLRHGSDLLNYIRIIGGTDAGVTEFPWQVSLQARGSGGSASPFCGGTIITPTKIVTAAHCVFDQDVTTLDVVAGVHNVFNPDGTEQRVRVASAKWHEAFDVSTYNNDVAVLTLSAGLQYNARVGQVPYLPTPNTEPSGSCVNTGWGNIRNDGGTEYPEKLQKVTLTVVPRPACADAYDGVNIINQGMICAGDTFQNKGSCGGDSGGPLVCSDGRGTYLAGIVSWGIEPCASDPAYPSVFTNVAHFIGWINAQL